MSQSAAPPSAPSHLLQHGLDDPQLLPRLLPRLNVLLAQISGRRVLKLLLNNGITFENNIW